MATIGATVRSVSEVSVGDAVFYRHSVTKQFVPGTVLEIWSDPAGKYPSKVKVQREDRLNPQTGEMQPGGSTFMLLKTLRLSVD